MFARILIGLLLTALSSVSQNRRALIIALDNYPKTSGWNEIHSSNDTLQLIPALITQKFSRSGITFVGAANGTKAGLKAAFEKFIKSCRRGNIIFIHYSGHGQQIADESRDEPDGYDEALVPIDAAARYQPGVYTGGNHLTDDELHGYLQRIADTIGPNGDMLVAVDACFSGTITRLLGYARGTDDLMASPEYIAMHKRMTANPKPIMNEKDSNELPYVLFTATDAYSKDFEVKVGNKHYGPLSYALAAAFNQMKEGETYGILEQRLRSQMALIKSTQVPVREGKSNKLVFNGQIVPNVQYFVSDEYLPSKKSFHLPFGSIQGLFDNTQVLFFDINADVSDTAKAWGRGTVVQAQSAECRVRIDSMGPQKPVAMMKFVITRAAYGQLSVGVKLDIADASLKNAIAAAIADKPSIKADDPSPSLWIEADNSYLHGLGKPENYLQVTTAKGDVLDSLLVSGNQEAVADRVRKKITEYMYGDYLSKVSVKNDFLRGTLDIVLGSCSTGKNVPIAFSPYDEKTYKQSGVEIKAKAGDCFRITVTNNGLVKFYFAVIVVDPLNRIKQLIPEQGRPPADYALIPPLTVSYTSPSPSQAYGFRPVKGKHVYKLLLSKSPMDLSLITDAAWRDASLIGRDILKALLLDASGGTRVATEMSANIMVANVIFDVQ